MTHRDVKILRNVPKEIEEWVENAYLLVLWKHILTKLIQLLDITPGGRQDPDESWIIAISHHQGRIGGSHTSLSLPGSSFSEISVPPTPSLFF